MNVRVAVIYLSMIAMCTAGGYLAGNCIKHVESSFMAHQKQMYYGVFPGKQLRADEQIRWQKIHDLQLQLVTLATSISGFLLGATMVNRNLSTATVPISKESLVFSTRA